ncbi:MAG: hypothetical protein K5780_03885 [Alphaproteobacteria bacterium]|nr:hypothetical protein [Alphaproteobacteria bacterium]
MKKIILYLVSFIVISTKLSAMCPEKNGENAKNLPQTQYNIANLQPSSTNSFEQNLSEFINLEALDDNNYNQIPDKQFANPNFNSSNDCIYPEIQNSNHMFMPTLLQQSKQELSNYLVHNILTNGNNNMKTILKDYLLKVEDVDKKKKELEIQFIERKKELEIQLIDAKKNFIQNVCNEMLKNDTSSASKAVDTRAIQNQQPDLSTNNTIGTSTSSESTKKRKFSSEKTDDSTPKQSDIVLTDTSDSEQSDNRKKRDSKRTSVYLLPINEQVYSRNKVISHWVTFFSKPENIGLSRSQIIKENEKSKYKTQEAVAIKNYVSNWNKLSQKKKTTFNKALKKRREDVEQKDAKGKIVNKLEDEDIQRDFFASEEIKNLINSGNAKENEKENSSISDNRFRIILRLVLGQKPGDAWDAEYLDCHTSQLTKYVRVGVVLSDISSGYKPDL